MLLKSQKNITDLIIGTGVTSGTGSNLASSLTAGQWGLAYQNGVLADPTGALTSDPVRFVYRSNDGSLIATPFFKKANAKYKALDYVAPAEQINYIGYVGSGTETIEALDNNDYLVRILLRGIQAIYGDKQMYKFGAYRSSASATNEEVALGLCQNLTTNFKREIIMNKEQKIKFELLTAAASVATSGGVLSVTNRSETVTIVESAGGANDAGKYNADASTAVVGDYLRIGHATATTTGVYKIVAITGAGGASCTVTLDRPYEGATNASLAAASAGVITNALAIANVYWGIKATGVARTAVAGTKNYEKVRFDMTLQDCGTTIVTESTRATEGSGYYQSVQELEWFFKGNRANVGLRLGTPPPVFVSDVNTSTQYALFQIDYYDASYDGLQGTPKSPGSVIIAVPTANYAATLGDIGTDWAFTAM